MKNIAWLLLIYNIASFAQDLTLAPYSIVLTPEEMNDIVANKTSYAYFGPAFCSLIFDLPLLHQQMQEKNISCKNLTALCDYIAQDKTTAPIPLIHAALHEILENSDLISSNNLQSITTYHNAFCRGIFDLGIAEPSDITRGNKCKSYCSVTVKEKVCAEILSVLYNATISGDLTVKGNETINQNLTVEGDETVQGDLTVLGTLHASTIAGGIDLIGTPQQACIVFFDASLNEKARICSSPIAGDKGVFVSIDGGTTQNLRVTNDGGTTITPSAGTGLTINSGGEVITSGNLTLSAGNIILPLANAGGTQGLLELGGTGANNVVAYESGTRNLFVGNGAVNSTVSGTDNISIGSSANNGLITQNNSIGIGSNAASLGTDSVVIGDTANTNAARTIVLGSRDSASTGVAPKATGINAIAIGSAQGTTSGAAADGINVGASIAIGGADGVFNGAFTDGNRTIALGLGSIGNSNAAILIGAASGTAGGLGPRSVERCSIAIGSARGANRAANPFNTSAIAIGGADDVFAGASALAVRSIAIGLNASVTPSTSVCSMALGSASGTAGGLAPTASATNSIAIGSAQGAVRGARTVSGQTIAIGSADGASTGASSTGVRAIAIGTGATINQTDGILLGAVTNTAVKVGIGISSPIAKLDIVGADGTPIWILNQVTTSLTSAPRWPNPSTSPVAGTPIHYNGTNQLFGFTSSQRYKKNIHSIEDESEVIYQLNPVLYDAKKGYGSEINISGFIAEDVYAIAPNLAVLDKNNQPTTIAYSSLHALTIKELQKHHQQITQHAQILNEHQQKLNTLLDIINHIDNTNS